VNPLEIVIDRSQCRRMQPFPGVEMYTTCGETMTVSLVEMQPGSVIPLHSHPHEQVGYMVAGRAEFTLGESRQVVGPGQIWRIPGGMPHQVVALDEPVRALDVFYPIREEYR
jgi:quercetin dioxygenase-like cupin family protein